MKFFQNKLKIKFNPTKIGILFFFLSIVFSLAFFPLILTVFLSGIIESIISFFTEINEYPNFSFKVMLILVVINFLVISLMIRFMLHEKVQRKNLYLIFPLFYFLNQCLANYLFWYLDCYFCGYKDGQLIFRFFDFIPIFMSASIFIMQGLFIDFTLRFIRKFEYFDPVLKQKRKNKEKELNFESKVNDLVTLYQNKSLEDLKDISADENWTLEARTAAKKILNRESNF